MRLCLIAWILLFALSACENPQPIRSDVLVSVKGQNLSRSEVTGLIPRGISSADSLLMAESIVKKWVKDVLVYDVASRNLGDEKAEVDRLVEEYRKSLVRYRYQERLVEEKLRADIRESEKRDFYERNPGKFVLDKSLIKGVFLKIPVDAPGLSDVRKWYKSADISSLEKIEKYSVQNAAIYEYFYDKWVDFDEVMGNIPMRVTDSNAFLKAHKSVEMADSAYCYLLNIKEYLPSGEKEPYEYAGPRIEEMLVNQRKVEYLRNFEDELYDDAIRSGDVQFHSEP